MRRGKTKHGVVCLLSLQICVIRVASPDNGSGHRGRECESGRSRGTNKDLFPKRKVFTVKSCLPPPFITTTSTAMTSVVAQQNLYSTTPALSDMISFCDIICVDKSLLTKYFLFGLKFRSKVHF